MFTLFRKCIFLRSFPATDVVTIKYTDRKRIVALAVGVVDVTVNIIYWDYGRREKEKNIFMEDGKAFERFFY